ncbi:MAG TPA: NAD(P)-binding domain-containing protein, partial [Allosphingosinicella sp.]
MHVYRDEDAELALIRGRRVAVLGYGNQGRAQALNLHDSGIDVVVGLRGGSGSRIEVEAAGITVQSLEDAVRGADVVMFLAPDEILGALYRVVEPFLREGTAIGFAHGLAVRFGFIEPRSDLD